MKKNVLAASFPKRLGLFWPCFGWWKSPPQIYIAHSVKNMPIAIHISTYISLLSIAGVFVGAFLLLLKLTALANKADCKSPAPVRSGSWVTVGVSCVFYLSSRSGGYLSSSFLCDCHKGEGSRFGLLHQKAPRWVTFLCNAEEPHSYLSPSLHLLELATSHFARDPSINSWVAGYLAEVVTVVYSYMLK